MGSDIRALAAAVIEGCESCERGLCGECTIKAIELARFVQSIAASLTPEVLAAAERMKNYYEKQEPLKVSDWEIVSCHFLPIIAKLREGT